MPPVGRETDMFPTALLMRLEDADTISPKPLSQGESVEAGATEGTWSIVSGSGGYQRLHGGGEITGDPTETGDPGRVRREAERQLTRAVAAGWGDPIPPIRPYLGSHDGSRAPHG
jgi:hypothetical protein